MRHFATRKWWLVAEQSAETDFLVGPGTVLPVFFLGIFGCAKTAVAPRVCGEAFFFGSGDCQPPTTRVDVAWQWTTTRFKATIEVD